LTTGAAATAATVLRWDALAWITAATLIVVMIRLRLFGHYEFGLLRHALAVRLSRLAARWLPRRPETEAPAEDPEVIELRPAEEQRRAA
jgi:hypothetical protein